ncbi:MAG: adenylate/guanylate cyclase domain-containing protein [Rhodobacterales bacterium]|nr:adenylate/guanylate cyclase domain-containing protein [Rhodobacterales bacterium]
MAPPDSTQPPGAAPRRLRLPIGGLMVVGFGGLVLLAVALVLAMGVKSTRDNTALLLRDRAERLIDSLERRLFGHFEPVEHQARRIQRDLAQGLIDPDDHQALADYLRGALSGVPQLTGLGLMYPDRTMDRLTRGTDAIRRVPVGREGGFKDLMAWAETATDSSWMAPVLVPDVKVPVLSLRTALRRADGTLFAVLVQGVTLSDLSRFLVETTQDSGQTPFILVNHDWVLAHPLLIDRSPQTGAEGPLYRLSDLGDGILESVWSESTFTPRMLENLDNARVAGIEVGEHNYAFVTRDIPEKGGGMWTIGTYFEAVTETAVIGRMVELIGVGLAVLALAVITALLVGRVASRPVQRLALATKAVESGTLSTVPRLEHSVLRELDDAAAAFNTMVEGLRERERIRTLFGQYVPRAIAQTLIQDDDGWLEAQAAEATVLFVDMEGFTALSERLTPDRLVKVLNAYFSVLVDILERHGGVVTQFQGDAILAIFNVPAPVPDHADQAVAAGCGILRQVAAAPIEGEWLNCRVGINTGPVVAGSVGAEGRLIYTVHGDAVNQAARLEQMNKELGTRLLVSQSTARLVQNCLLREVGTVGIRGKTHPVVVFSLTE